MRGQCQHLPCVSHANEAKTAATTRTISSRSNFSCSSDELTASETSSGMAQCTITPSTSPPPARRRARARGRAPARARLALERVRKTRLRQRNQTRGDSSSMSLSLLGQGFCRDRVCADPGQCDHSWTVVDQCVNSTSQCQSLCGTCKALAVAAQPPTNHPGGCSQLNLARCVLYYGNAWAVTTYEHPSYECYSIPQPPLPPQGPPPPAPPPLSPSPLPPPPPAVLALLGVGPWSAPTYGAIGTTSSGGVEPDGSLTHERGEAIYGPLESAISEGRGHGALLRALGCPAGLGNVPAGVDTRTAEQMLARQCNVTIPRTGSTGERIGLLTACGGHGSDFHFHERLSCVNPGRDANLGHSLQVGQALDGKAIYGAFETFENTSTSAGQPILDACGGHFGPVPQDSTGASYHYHVSEKPPFTLGCFGPAGAYANGSSALVGESAHLVTVDECRALYPSVCGDNSPTTIQVASGEQLYDLGCPCFDELGGNVVISNSSGTSDDGARGGGGARRSRRGISGYTLILSALGLTCIVCQCCCFCKLRRAQRKRMADGAPAQRIAPAARVAPKHAGRTATRQRDHSVRRSAQSQGKDTTPPPQPTPATPAESRQPLEKAEVEKLSIRELRALATERGVSLAGCVEKHDLVERLLE